MAQPTTGQGRRIKAVLFDFMGTCLDWHSGVVGIFPQSISQSTRSEMALRWRQMYFDSNSARLHAGQPPEDIDVTLRRTLEALLEHESYQHFQSSFSAALLQGCVDRWHRMPAWPEVRNAITDLQSKGYETLVFANGTPRLQMDLCRSSGLRFDMLFSSALLGVYKPAPESYSKVLDLIKLNPEETVMVAAHAYDLRGAKDFGMRTVYVNRWTDDTEEDKETAKAEFEVWLEDMQSLPQVISQFEDRKWK